MRVPPVAVTLFLVTTNVSSVTAMQIARRTPKSITGEALLTSQHHAYVDQKVRSRPYNVLNHEAWYQRHVVLSPSLPPSPSSNTPSSSLSSTDHPSDPARLQPGLYMMEDQRPDNTAIWESKTDKACNMALNTLNGVATNPSGLATCYNVQNFNSSTGSFQADLRLYRIAGPTGDWTQLDTQAVKVDVTYAGASIATQFTTKVKREELNISLPPLQRDEARDMFLRRSNGVPPKKLQELKFVGQVHGDMMATLGNDTTAHILLLPITRVSAARQDGALVQTTLSLQDASFVNGFFTDYAQIYSSSPSESSDQDDNVVRAGASSAVFSIDLVITTVWALLMVIVTGYGTATRLRSRNDYRRRIKQSLTGEFEKLRSS